jgi:hypothetical protein
MVMAAGDVVGDIMGEDTILEMGLMVVGLILLSPEKKNRE